MLAKKDLNIQLNIININFTINIKNKEEYILSIHYLTKIHSINLLGIHYSKYPNIKMFHFNMTDKSLQLCKKRKEKGN